MDLLTFLAIQHTLNVQQSLIYHLKTYQDVFGMSLNYLVIVKY